MLIVSRMILVLILCAMSLVEGSQCCSQTSAQLVRSKWREVMRNLDAKSKVLVVQDIITSLSTRTPWTADIIKGRLAQDPVLRKAGDTYAVLMFLQKLDVMIQLINRHDALDKQVQHVVMTNHLHYGPELDALTQVMEATFWGLFQIGGLNPAYWYSCVFQILHLLEFHTAQAITQRNYARCDVSPDTGDPNQRIEGLIVFEQSKKGGSTVVRGRLSGFDTTDDDIIHGFHIHSIPALGNQCNDAAKHYNPEGLDHGAPYEDNRHIGDLGNIVENEEGVSDIYLWDHKVSLVGEHSVINRTIMIHESYDSFRRPSTYGGRLACCIITPMATPKIEQNENTL